MASVPFIGSSIPAVPDTYYTTLPKLTIHWTEQGNYICTPLSIQDIIVLTSIARKDSGYYIENVSNFFLPKWVNDKPIP